MSPLGQKDKIRMFLYSELQSFGEAAQQSFHRQHLASRLIYEQKLPFVNSNLASILTCMHDTWSLEILHLHDYLDQPQSKAWFNARKHITTQPLKMQEVKFFSFKIAQPSHFLPKVHEIPAPNPISMCVLNFCIQRSTQKLTHLRSNFCSLGHTKTCIY